MSGNTGCAVYIGNLDERVTDRVLYDILIQAGRVVDLYIPRDKESDRPKGFAFAEYETKEIAEYAVRLFSGLVSLYSRTLKFAISGQDKPSSNPSTSAMPASSVYRKQRALAAPAGYKDTHQNSDFSTPPPRVSAYPSPYSDVPAPPGVTHHTNGYGSHFNTTNYDYNRRLNGSTLGNLSRSRRYDTNNAISYQSY